MRIYPTPKQFERLAEGVTHIPVWAEILSDRDTPVTAFQKIHRGKHGFLLESAEGGERWGRYSFLATEPAAIVRANGREMRIEWADGRVEEHHDVDPLLQLRELLGRYQIAEVPDLPRLHGGLVGWIGYDAVRFIEDLPDAPPDDMDLPELGLLLVDTLVVFDNRKQKILLLTHADLRTTDDLSQARADAISRLEELAARLDASPPELPARIGEPVAHEVQSNLSPQRYGEMVLRAKEYIKAGDIIQVVLSQRFTRETTARPFDVYRCLRSINPSPYLTYLELDGLSVVSGSPEVLVRLEGGTMTVRPIAGTRARAADPAEDAKLEESLLADPKERAEHVMLLDLGRNDVGRVAAPGTVRVTEEFQIERYSHVMHIVSNVEGKLAPGLDAIDALRAAFPAGTLSGAPKVRAMQIIDELEPLRRGLYGGALGYLGFDGVMDTAITIRTALMRDGRAWVQAGAGIVYDSVPETEHDECERKSRSVLAAIEMAEGLV
ncbi:MAG: anthranilate synthase component I [Deltaproteobacteria bacterium]